MKAKSIFCFLVALFVVTSLIAQERGPAAVSPGSDVGIAIVGESCPTFSWTGVEWAEAYRVAVFEAVSAEALPYEEMETMASPVLSKEIQGRALSWTPSSEERLNNGGQYVWYVQATDTYGNVTWSEGKVFKVEVEARLVGMEEAVRESLKEHGVSDEMIDDVLRDMQSGVREVLVWGVDAEGSRSKTQEKIGIQGTEGANNTFYGLEAGFNIAAGGNYNSFFGRNAGYSTTTGYRNTFVGHNAGYTNLGNSNTFIGYSAGYFNTTGAANTFIGQEAGFSNTTADSNTCMGYQAGGSNTTGSWNTYVGYRAGRESTGAFSTFMGYQAGYKNQGIRNTFIGTSTGYSNTSGARNTYLGFNAGYNNTTGSGNVFLGSEAGYNDTGSNRLYIDNSNTSSPLIYGEFDNDILAINGNLGVGTQSPGYPMHLQKTGSNAAFIADRTDGAINYINATAGYGNFGTVNNYPLRIVVNAVWRMRLDSDNSLTMANGATCSAGGKWTDASSRELKENIHSLTTEEAVDALGGLNPVKYNYKSDKEDDCVGFIAEEVPDLVASKDRKGMSPMDVVAVLTKVVQEQQEILKEQRKRDEEQQRTIEELRGQIDELKKNK